MASRTRHLVTEAPERPIPDPIRSRLEAQIKFYDEGALRNSRLYHVSKVVELMAAAAVAPVSALGGPVWVTASLGSLIVVLEGTQHVFQFHDRWIAYRSTCEAIRHERYLYLVGAGPYAGARQPDIMLAERVENLMSHEHAQWTSVEAAEAKREDSAH